MRSLSSLGIGLSLVVGFLLLALVAELYYLLWWKKRSTLSSSDMNPGQQDPQLQLHSNSSSKHFLLSPFFENSVERELMTVHNLSGPPRFLFTIKEETKEDLESEGSRNKSLRDFLLSVETPFLTPLSSPPFFTPPLTPINSYNHHGFNPLFESDVGSVRSSPPPKFKFLKDAEEKLYRRKVMEEAERYVHETSDSVNSNGVKALAGSSMVRNEEEDGSGSCTITSSSST